MRRPAPLPQTPRTARPAHPAPAVDEEWDRFASGEAGMDAGAGAIPEHPDAVDASDANASDADAPDDDVAAAVRAAWGDEPLLTAAPRASTAAAGTPAEPEPATPGQTPVRTRDVWRAARARRRALRGEVRRFTGRARRRRTTWIVAVAALVVLVVGTVGIAYSPLFGLERISVEGTQALPADAIEQALAGQLGTPLPLVDESAIKQVLIGFPLVESYTLEARPPHDLIVRIVERTPIGVVQTDAGWSLVDAAGVVLETTQTAPEGRATIDVPGDTRSDAFEAIALVMRALPDEIRAQVAAVAATTRDDVTLTLAGTGSRVIWGSVDDTPLKARTLVAAMTQFPPGTVGMYDVSSPGAIVTR